MNRRTNGILNEAIAAWWGGIRAAINCLFTWQPIIETWDGDQLLEIRVGARIFYEYGRY